MRKLNIKYQLLRLPRWKPRGELKHEFKYSKSLFWLDAEQGADEQRSEVYMTYSERVAESTTQLGVRSGGGVAGSADKQADASEKTLFGFWVYIMTDCVLFASLFATYAVLRKNTFGGPGGAELFSLPFVLTETLVLLTSSFTIGLSLLAAREKLKNHVQLWLSITFILGIVFLLLEMHEFTSLVHEGNSWRRSGFLSAFFTLVGTHGLHITVGLIWMAVMRYRIWRQGITRVNLKRLTMLGLFWHFLDVIWIFIFTIVYLFGVVL